MSAEPQPSPSPFAIVVQQNGQQHVLFDPEPQQLEVMLAALGGQHLNIFVWGNRGGGKSVTARMLAHTLALSKPNLTYYIIRRSYKELEKTHLKWLQGEMQLLRGDDKGYNKSEHIAYYPNGSRGYYSQCDSEDDAGKILGAEAALIIFDEAPELEWEWMQLIAGSTRVTKASGVETLVLYLGNPIGASIEELWAHFIDKDVDRNQNPEYNPDDWHAIELRLEHNSHIDAEKYRKRLAGLSPQYRKAWLEGVRVEDRALFELAPTREREEADPSTQRMVKVRRPYHILDALPTMNGHSVLFEPWIRIYRSYDHGFIDPAVCLWFAVVGKRIICFHEQVWTRTPADQIAREILQSQIIYDDQHPGGYVLPVSETFCDPSIDLNDGSVQTIRDAMELQKLTLPNQKTLSLPLTPSVNNREQCADAIQRALKEEVEAHTPRIAFVQSGCPYLIRSLPKMKFDERNPRRMADHKHDHSVVALGYFLMSWIPTTAPPISSPSSAAQQWLRESRAESRAQQQQHRSPFLGRKHSQYGR